MASVKTIPIDGARPAVAAPEQVLTCVCRKKRKCEQQLVRWSDSHVPPEGHAGRHFRDMEWLEKFIQESRRHPRVSNSPVDFRVACQLGNQRLQSTSFNCEFATRHVVQRGLLKEHVYDLKRHNKVFCSQWLCSGRSSGDSIVLGTKCNTVSARTLILHSWTDCHS